MGTYYTLLAPKKDHTIMSDNINIPSYFYLRQTYRHWVCCPFIRDTLFSDEHGPHMGWLKSNILEVDGIYEMGWRTDVKLMITIT